MSSSIHNEFATIAHAHPVGVFTGMSGSVAALGVLVVVVPIVAFVGLLVFIDNRGTIFVRRPTLRSDGRLVYRTEFRTTPGFSPDGYDANGLRETRLGRFLQGAGIARLPNLLDRAAARLTFRPSQGR